MKRNRKYNIYSTGSTWKAKHQHRHSLFSIIEDVSGLIVLILQHGRSNKIFFCTCCLSSLCTSWRLSQISYGCFSAQIFFQLIELSQAEVQKALDLRYETAASVTSSLADWLVDRLCDRAKLFAQQLQHVVGVFVLRPAHAAQLYRVEVGVWRDVAGRTVQLI